MNQLKQLIRDICEIKNLGNSIVHMARLLKTKDLEETDPRKMYVVAPFCDFKEDDDTTSFKLEEVDCDKCINRAENYKFVGEFKSFLKQNEEIEAEAMKYFKKIAKEMEKNDD